MKNGYIVELGQDDDGVDLSLEVLLILEEVRRMERKGGKERKIKKGYKSEAKRKVIHFLFCWKS